MGMNVSNTLANTFRLKAAIAINTDDAVGINGLNGKAIPVKTTDYAAVTNMAYGTPQTSTGTGRVVAQTTVVSAYQTSPLNREALLRVASGDIYTLTSNSTNVGLRLSRYSAAGALIGYVTVAAGTVRNGHTILELSNGNIAILAGGASMVACAVYDQNLLEIKALTDVVQGYSIYGFAAIALSGGGFAIVSQPTSNSLQTVLLTFDNSGSAVLTETVIMTRTGSTGDNYYNMAQLSDGNLAIADSINGSDQEGLSYGVVTVGGASVLAFTQIDTSAQTEKPSIEKLTGFFCISRGDGTNKKARVFNNAGALQGAPFSSASNSIPYTDEKLLTDGTRFIYIWSSTSTNVNLTKLPTTGTGYITQTITTSPTNHKLSLDGFYENGFIVCVSRRSAALPHLWVINASNGLLVSAAGTEIGTGTVTDIYPRVIPGGDCTFLAMYSYAAGPETYFVIGKYANTSVVGAASSGAAEGDYCTMYQGAGTYTVNAIGGSPAIPFDHTTGANVVGNKGTLLNNGLVLRGM